MIKRYLLLSLVLSMLGTASYAEDINTFFESYPILKMKYFRDVIDQYNKVAAAQLSKKEPLVDNGWANLTPSDKDIYLQVRNNASEQIRRYRFVGGALEGIELDYQFALLRTPAGSGIVPITSASLVTNPPSYTSGVSPDVDCLEATKSQVTHRIESTFMTKGLDVTNMIQGLLQDADINCSFDSGSGSHPAADSGSETVYPEPIPTSSTVPGSNNCTVTGYSSVKTDSVGGLMHLRCFYYEEAYEASLYRCYRYTYDLDVNYTRCEPSQYEVVVKSLNSSSAVIGCASPAYPQSLLPGVVGSAIDMVDDHYCQ